MTIGALALAGVHGHADVAMAAMRPTSSSSVQPNANKPTAAPSLVADTTKKLCKIAATTCNNHKRNKRLRDELEAILFHYGGTGRTLTNDLIQNNRVVFDQFTAAQLKELSPIFTVVRTLFPSRIKKLQVLVQLNHFLARNVENGGKVNPYSVSLLKQWTESPAKVPPNRVIHSLARSFLERGEDSLTDKTISDDHREQLQGKLDRLIELLQDEDPIIVARADLLIRVATYESMTGHRTMLLRQLTNGFLEGDRNGLLSLKPVDPGLIDALTADKKLLKALTVDKTPLVASNAAQVLDLIEDRREDPETINLAVSFGRRKRTGLLKARRGKPFAGEGIHGGLLELFPAFTD